MTKWEMAEYLVNLESLMTSIQATGTNRRPTWLIQEYERIWTAFKQEVQDEARAKS